jgi:hypothetical protein
MDLYFSHSYRDERINTYFCTEFGRQGFQLYADQKSPIWCVAKLERYLDELSGFISIIPRRAISDNTLAYSPWIGHELSLARRGRVPRLLFVDDDILGQYRSDFPSDAVPFVYTSPESGQFRHRQAVEKFRNALENRQLRARREYNDRQATIVAAGSQTISDAADQIRESLIKNFRVMHIKADQLRTTFDNNFLLETLLASELCVFLLDTQLTTVDLALAMAHAQFVPSIRLRYDVTSTDLEPPLSGQITWSRPSDIAKKFQEQLDSFRNGFVDAVNLSKIAATDWKPEDEDLWDPLDGESLKTHLAPTDPFVRDEVEIVGRIVGGVISQRTSSQVWNVVRAFYDDLKRRHFYYERELKMVGNRQAIRTPADISKAGSATCIDTTCLFASLLKASGQSPVIVLVEISNQGNRRAHSLVGYVPPSGFSLPSQPTLEDLRSGVNHQDVILLESTGFLESEQPVGAETEEERRVGGKMLDFLTAKQSAERLIMSDVALRFVADLRDIDV